MSNSGKKWPYLISGSILIIIIAAVVTVVFALKHPVQLSNDSMLDYHDADAKMNTIINQKIAFNKLYDLSLDSNISDMNNPSIVYTIKDKNGAPVTDAEITLLVTHPFILEFDKKYMLTYSADGKYSSDAITIAKKGRWNYVALIKIGEHQRYHNAKADTRYTETFEY